MPTYVLHGFRWPRPLIRIHIILQNLDDAAAEWLMAPKTTLALLKNFNQIYPECMEHLHRLRFIEQYDPSDLSANAASQPFAYVADVVEEVRLGVEIDEIRGRGLNNDQWTALMELRDKLAPEEKVGWYIVVCGDEERLAPPTDLEGQSTSATSSSARGSDSDGQASANGTDRAAAAAPNPEPKGLRKLFGSARLGRRKSRTPLDESNTRSNKSKSRGRDGVPSRDGSTPPPVPGTSA